MRAVQLALVIAALVFAILAFFGVGVGLGATKELALGVGFLAVAALL